MKQINKRRWQILTYGWKDAKEIANLPKVNKNRISIFLDIWKCFKKYYILSIQYKKNKMWAMSDSERQHLGDTIGKRNKWIDEFRNDYFETKAFLHKYTSRYYDRSSRLRKKRIKAYTERFHLGEDCNVQFNVEFSREHYLDGKLIVGKKVLFAKNVFIDYSGEVIIHDGVKFANGVIIESHHRDLEAFKNKKNVNIPTKIEIGENAYIGSRAMILDSCNYIGKNARIGAGAVVTKDIPDNALAVGVPAKLIKIFEE